MFSYIRKDGRLTFRNEEGDAVDRMGREQITVHTVSGDSYYFTLDWWGQSLGKIGLCVRYVDNPRLEIFDDVERELDFGGISKSIGDKG